MRRKVSNPCSDTPSWNNLISAEEPLNKQAAGKTEGGGNEVFKK